MQLIVLGVHRAGTSVLCRLLNMMGAYIGPEGNSIPISAENPKGFWERRDVRDLDEELLGALGASWYAVSNVDLGRLDGEAQHSFEQRAREILHDLDAHRPWVLKEPRMSVLFDWWRPLLEVPICIIAHRNPLDVACSLRERNGFPLSFGLALWEAYMSRALRSSAGLPRLIVSHERWVSAPVDAVAELLERLEALHVRGLNMPSQREIEAFVASDLVHQRSTDEAIRAQVTPSQWRLHEALRSGSAAADDFAPELSEACLDLLRLYEGQLADRAALAAERERTAAHAEELRRRDAAHAAAMARRDVEVAALRKEIGASGRAPDSSRQAVVDLESRLERAQARTEQLTSEVGERTAALRRSEEEAAALRARVAAIEAQSSRRAELEEQVDALRGELASAAAERQRLEATVQEQRRRANDEAGRARLRASAARKLAGQLEAELAALERERDGLAAKLAAEIAAKHDALRGLERWYAEVEDAFRMLVGSNRYKVGGAIADAYRNVRRQPLDVSFEENVARTLQRGRKQIDAALGKRGSKTPSAAELAGRESEAPGLRRIVKRLDARRDGVVETVSGVIGRAPTLLVKEGYKHARNRLVGGPVLHKPPDWQLVRDPREYLPRRLADRLKGEAPALPVAAVPAPAAASSSSATAAPRGALPTQLLNVSNYATAIGELREIANGPVFDVGLVSIVVLTHNNCKQLKEVIDHIRTKTAYPRYEIVVVDNGSTDETPAFLGRLALPDIISVRNDENRSFSEGNNIGARAARGDYLVFLNDDMEPVHGWLCRMMEALRDQGAAVVGAHLVYPELRGLDKGGDTVLPGFTTQHSGIFFRYVGGQLRPYNRQHAHYLPERREPERVPAVTAACLLIRRETFEQIEGFTEGYWYGYEDVDLCLQISERGGTIWYAPRAALLHHEAGTQRTVDRELKAEWRRGNMRRFDARWSETLERQYWREKVQAGAFLSERSMTLAMLVTETRPKSTVGDLYTGRGLGEALRRKGWRVQYLARRPTYEWEKLSDHVDAVMSFRHDFDIRRLSGRPGLLKMAWVRSYVDEWAGAPWIGEYDVVFSTSELARELLGLRLGDRTITGIVPLGVDPEVFRPGVSEPDMVCDAVFVGNIFEVPRQIASSLDLSNGLDFRFYGRFEPTDRESHPFRRYHRGLVAYEQLPAVYGSARVVLDDATPMVAPWGCVNSRVYEAMACGAPVITNHVPGLEEAFGEAVLSYEEPAELNDHLRRLLKDERLRRRVGEAAVACARERHSYDQRAEKVIELMRDWI